MQSWMIVPRDALSNGILRMALQNDFSLSWSLTSSSYLSLGILTCLAMATSPYLFKG